MLLTFLDIGDLRVTSLDIGDLRGRGWLGILQNASLASEVA